MDLGGTTRLAIASTGVPLADNPWQDPRLLAATAALVAVLLIGAGVIAFVDRWRKRAASDQYTANEEMASYRAMYEAGELTAEEYARLKGKMRDKLKRELDTHDPRGSPKPPSPPPAPASPPTRADGSDKTTT
jgi:uncharacterized membrane protein YcjF (UPF0283 family)